jgi:quercetin dioxygenase-like cupin family protein
MSGLDPTEVFVSILGEYARRVGGPTPSRLATEIDSLSSTRLRIKPKREPITSRLAACLTRGPAGTADLRGAVADMAAGLHWKTGPNPPWHGAFARRHAYCEVVGPTARIPSDRLLVGLFMMAPDTHYPPHEHTATELYLPLSGPVKFGLDFKPPRTRAPGRFVTIASGRPHAIETFAETILMAWAWLGEIDGPYRVSVKP